MLAYESKYPRRAIASHDKIFKFNTVFLFQLFMKVISLVHLLLKFNYKPNC